MSSRKNKNKEIKISGKPSDDIGIKANVSSLRSMISDGNALFLFRYFYPNSVRVGDFNNYYANKMSATRGLIEFMGILKTVSRINHEEIFAPQFRKSVRIKKIKDDDGAIDRIEKILVDGYNMPSETVRQFERLYVELAFGDGHRLISVCADGVFEILFVDNNHLVCRESSRSIKLKENFCYPSLLDDTHLLAGANGKNMIEYNIAEMVMEEIINDRCTGIQEAKELYIELSNVA